MAYTALTDPYGIQARYNGSTSVGGGGAGSGGGFSILPAIVKGMPGFKVKGTFKKGGKVKKMAKGGSTASKRADGCATKGKTKGRFV